MGDVSSDGTASQVRTAVVLDPTSSAPQSVAGSSGLAIGSAMLAGSSYSPEEHLSPEAAATGRPFRSKKIRPCDGCRKRKNRCAITREGDPCVECRQTGRPCTFLLPPPTRPKRESAPPTTAGIPIVSFTPAFDNALHQSTPELGPRKRPAGTTGNEPASKRIFASSGRPSMSLASLDRDLPAGVEPCAVTATLTDDLLSHQTVGTSRQISSDRNRSQFILFHAVPSHRTSSADFEATLLKRISSFLSSIVPYLSETTLLDQYLRNIHPFMPVLPISPSHSTDSLPPGLKAAILVDALSSYPEHRDAGSFAWRLIKEARLGERLLETPNLSSLAMAVLELGTTLDQRGDYGLLAKTIAHAQLLGLHVDCSSWALPTWEKALRSRMWWCLRIHDAWASFLSSRPSHIQAGNTNVPLLPFSSPEDDSEAYAGSIAFQCSCRLAIVVAKLQSEVSTLDKYGSATRAESCDGIERELNIMADTVRPHFDRLSRPTGMDCFLFTLLALRCMVRRISIEVRIGLGNTFAPDGSTLSIFAELVDFFGSLASDAFGGEQPWLPYTSHILSSTVSSLIRISLAALSTKYSTPTTTSSTGTALPQASPSLPAAPSAAVHLLARLSFFIQRARDEHGWTLADAALSRAKSVADRLSQAMDADAASGDYGEVVNALVCTSLSDPALSVCSSATDNGVSMRPPARLEALSAMATLAEHPRSSASEAVPTNADGNDGSFTTHHLDFFGADIIGPDANTQDLNPEAFTLPELEEWLNVLDRAPAWGFDLSPPGVALS